MEHTAQGTHTCELLPTSGTRRAKVTHITCTCGWSGEAHVFAWHVTEEAKRRSNP